MFVCERKPERDRESQLDTETERDREKEREEEVEKEKLQLGLVGPIMVGAGACQSNSIQSDIVKDRETESE